MQLLKRTEWCGQIGTAHCGKQVIISGWVQKRRNLGGLVFLDVRDRTGVVQVVFDPSVNNELTQAAQDVRSEYVIAIQGVGAQREASAVNKAMATGHVEIQAAQLVVFSKSAVMPFPLEDDAVSEELRLTYRYLDLRRKKMFDFLQLRHDVIHSMRQYFNEHGFLEVETPILSKSTPEGARDFLVPCRLQPELFYALPQSPQIYKQLLMVGGIERYFQIARCFRDEALRSNRQPEFTQLDIEMSFVDEIDIQTMCEGLFARLWKQFLGKELSLPLARFSYQDVFSRYGSDKPDTRFGLEIADITSLFHDGSVGFLTSIVNDGGHIGAFCVKDKRFSRSELDALSSFALKELGAKGLLWVRKRDDGSYDSAIAKNITADFWQHAREKFQDLTDADTLFIVAGRYEQAWTILGQLRLHIGKKLDLIDQSKQEMFWVTDFPMFEWNEDEKRWEAKHHPFTSPEQGWELKELGDVKARAYDLVCNGEELGGGSIRIHDAAVQEKVFAALGISAEKAREKFGFLLEAQGFGYPPDGGIAFGIDRMIMMLGGTDSIRDVIAFPKTTTGSCLMMQTPASVEQNQLDDLHLVLSSSKKS